jgi:telomerase reverse transcriptase
MKYIFPRQFGLHNVFTSTVDKNETTHAFKDYTLREHEIANYTGQGRIHSHQNNRVPKRLRGQAIALVRKLQRMHYRCSYVELLKHYCPIDVR